MVPISACCTFLGCRCFTLIGICCANDGKSAVNLFWNSMTSKYVASWLAARLTRNKIPIVVIFPSNNKRTNVFWVLCVRALCLHESGGLLGEQRKTRKREIMTGIADGKLGWGERKDVEKRKLAEVKHFESAEWEKIGGGEDELLSYRKHSGAVFCVNLLINDRSNNFGSWYNKAVRWEVIDK